MFELQNYLSDLFAKIRDDQHPGHRLAPFLEDIEKQISRSHGELLNWDEALTDFKKVASQNEFVLNIHRAIEFSSDSLLNDELDEISTQLRKLSPWRKGPFQINELKVDTEWQSWMKWDRIAPHIEPYLKGKMVLDIGCSSGYYMYRMLEHQPKWVLGVDPTLVFFYQFLATQALKSTTKLSYLPVGSEAIEETPRMFDTVFCMGILYHRKSPFEFIRSLQQRLKPGGTLVMETLMVPGEGPWALTPVDRYARMRNCFTLPTKDAMIFWLESFGFKDIHWVHDDWTPLEEQRTTEWMPRESLAECLDPNDPLRTVEGYPAPRRCLVFATAK